MPKASRDSLKAKGKTDVYFFDPNDLVLVKDKDDLLYDARVEDAVNEDLVANLMYMPDGKTPIGIIEPVIGRRNGESGKIEVVAGRDRVKAAREANRRFKSMGGPQIRVPVWIRRMDDSSVLASLVSENEHRRADSPLNRAKKLLRYMNLGHDEEEAAALFGVSESTVRNMLRLLDAPAAVRHAVDAGKITATDAYKLAREEPDDAKKKLGKLLDVAPRTPGKKKQDSKSASKARAVLRGPEKPRPKSNGAKVL
jgi:ParB family chromosome partitioning protein